MKNFGKLFLFTIAISLILLTASSCELILGGKSTPTPTPVITPDPTATPVVTPTATATPVTATTPTPVPTAAPSIQGLKIYLDIPKKQIIGATVAEQFSLDNGTTWTDCNSSIIPVNLAIGNNVWLRDKNDTNMTTFLGSVNNLTGFADIVSSGKIWVGDDNWVDEIHASTDENKTVKFYFANIGNSTFYNANFTISIYLSSDKKIETNDTLLGTVVKPYSYDIGDNHWGENYIFNVPDIAAGTYYVGLHMDSTNVITELNEGNNFTLPNDVATLVIQDNTTLGTGAVKVVNSWGNSTNSTWENVKDGHYWITYDTMKHQEMAIYYYYNNFNQVYQPTTLAVFQLTHPKRNESKVTLGLGDPNSPYMMKELQSRFGSTLKSGPEPFPNNKMVLDISEFAGYINDYNLFLKVENLGSTGGTIDNFSVEFYSDYSTGTPFKTITGGTGTIASTGNSTVTAVTKNSLTVDQIEQILPLPRSDQFGTTFVEEKPGEAELLADMRSAGVYEDGKNYNIIIDGKYGTGLQPLSESDWRSMNKLRGVQSENAYGTLPTSIDWSATQYFPPIGSQGSEGTCVAFAIGYYIHSFMEAREHNWDYSSVSWDYSATTLSDGGEPTTMKDKLFSPDFIYHQINSGLDNGSNYKTAISLLIRQGAASWQSMPYNTTDHTTWPSETAWREAPKYRGREVSNTYWDYNTCGYFVIRTDQDIQLLKSLIASGYLVTTAIKSASPGLFDLMSSQDVVNDTTAALMTTDHAQTLVGYKEGADWNPSTPDN